jgi:ABC-type nitrate/sulfonate/bicarbonate transport system permease component
MTTEPRAVGLRNALILLAIWELIGQFGLVAGGALPPPSDVLFRLWQERSDYPRHVLATLQASVAGFIIGNVMAVVAGILFSLSPSLLRLFRGINIAAFALPPIAIAPILSLTMSDMAPRITLAALGVYFITMTATVIGIAQADSRAEDVIRAYGGSHWKVLQLVQFRGAVPSILAGLRVAAPNAVLGSILAEFGGGGRWGLGAYLLGSLGRVESRTVFGELDLSRH